jgi:hypothetical protein
MHGRYKVDTRIETASAAALEVVVGPDGPARPSALLAPVIARMLQRALERGDWVRMDSGRLVPTARYGIMEETPL